jgi:hypothetical protein
MTGGLLLSLLGRRICQLRPAAGGVVFRGCPSTPDVRDMGIDRIDAFVKAPTKRTTS